MTGRERLVAAARGGETDRPATLFWPCPKSEGSDALILENAKDVVPDADRAVLVEVANPFGQALARDLDLNAALVADPDAPALEEMVEATRTDLRNALDAGADGVFYVLHGACGRWCSPMQYGGWYLERDRELLEEIADARLNVLFVVGSDDTYLDFVSDLPAHVFAWDSAATAQDSASVRAMRNGAQASADAHSEIRLVSPGPIAPLLER